MRTLVIGRACLLAAVDSIEASADTGPRHDSLHEKVSHRGRTPCHEVDILGRSSALGCPETPRGGRREMREAQKGSPPVSLQGGP